MKLVFEIMDKCGKQFVHHFSEKQQYIQTVNIYDAFTRYTSDVIFDTLLGVEVDSFREPNNEFYFYGKQASSLIGPRNNLKLILLLLCPNICKASTIYIFQLLFYKFFSPYFCKKNGSNFCFIKTFDKTAKQKSVHSIWLLSGCMVGSHPTFG